MSEFSEAKKLLESTGHLVIENIEKTSDYHFEKMMKITELLYDNIEELRYDDARDIAEYIYEKMESLDVDREYIAEKLENLLDDCGVRIHYDLASRLASKIIAL